MRPRILFIIVGALLLSLGDAAGSSMTNGSFLPNGSMDSEACADVVATISGTVFEDINYGGGAGRNYAVANTSAQASGWASGDIGLANVRIELYTDLGLYIGSETTDANGEYTFIGLMPGTYSVRFATKTAVSIRGSNGTAVTAYAVPTFRSDGTTEYFNEVGGLDPNKQDADINTTSLDLSLLSAVTTVAQSVSSLLIVVGANTGVDLGLSFNVISNSKSDGIGSLRQFILNANELDNVNIDLEDHPSGRPLLVKAAGEDVSIFEISGAGAHTITIATDLPRIRDEYTHISGYTQSGSSQGSNSSRIINVELIGSAITIIGLYIYADDVYVSGLSFGNLLHGVYTNRANNQNVHIWGNYIGLRADGSTSTVNDGSGVYLYASRNSFVGIDGDNVNDENEGNVISSFEYGVQLSQSGGILIAGNYIGTSRFGVSIRPNLYVGIHLGYTSLPCWVGFKDDLVNKNPDHYRNILSGNGNDGVRVVSSNNQVVSGNYMGTSVSGDALLKNILYGIQITGNSSGNIIGTNSNGSYDLLERNVIAGNIGVRLGSSGSGSDNVISGNYIGVDHTGNVSLAGETGILINGAYTNTVIGTNADNVLDEIEGNVISGHLADGIRFYYTGSASVSGNKIGVGSDGITSLGNADRGIYLEEASSNVTIGWNPSMANIDHTVVGNIIKNNTDSGIGILGSGANYSSGIRISRNSIANNGGLGIGLHNALYDFTVTSNDNGDSDTGENGLINFPVFEQVFLDGNELTVSGFSPAGSTIEFFLADGGVNPSPLPAGYGANFGEGETFLFSRVEGDADDLDATTSTYTDDGTGASTARTESRFSFKVDVTGLGISDSDFITSTATDVINNTSEFSGASGVLIPEICNDGIDNDGDGDIDCDDDICPNAKVVSHISF